MNIISNSHHITVIQSKLYEYIKHSHKIDSDQMITMTAPRDFNKLPHRKM